VAAVLEGVAVVSADNVWAVGLGADGVPGDHDLIFHWDGMRWSDIVQDTCGCHLFGIAAVSANDIWAVGNAGPDTMVLHWDGTRWSGVSGPGGGALLAAAAVSPDDVWAVGYDQGTSIAHWNGTQWSMAPSPNPGSTDSQLSAVSAISSNDVWAAGRYLSASGYQTLIEHWDGSLWTIVPSPNMEGTPNELYGLSAHATNDVWAVGYSGGYDQGRTLILHWNGTQWDIVPSPNPGVVFDHLNGVTSISANDAWAVGLYRDNNSYHSLALHWDDTNWTSIYNPTTLPLSAVAAVSAREIWAVGGSGITLVERYGVPILFSDVPPANPFYPYIQCLACQGVVSGYPDGTFRPNNVVTRGQLSKIVDNAANLQLPVPSGQQSFEDVPIQSTFWLYVERLAEMGFAEGYRCGSEPTESCVPPHNRPYFRPGAPASRGQTAKILSNVAGYASPCLGQFFEDVPASNPFWCYIQRTTASGGAFSGYPCGGPGERCVPPNNLPYFRPSRNATRGQVVKSSGKIFELNCITLQNTK
jgi:hypothetical protein